MKICEMIGHDATFIKHGRAIARAIGGPNGVEVVALYLAALITHGSNAESLWPYFFGRCQARNGSGSVLFKFVTDVLTGNDLGLPMVPLFLLTPFMLVIGFISMRVMTIGFNQLRDALFARVGQHAVRQLAFKTFTHIHKLSLRFHLERRTGGLSRVIERGTKGIESIVRYTILNSLPVVLEFALYAGIFFIILDLCGCDCCYSDHLHWLHNQNQRLANAHSARNE